MTQQLGTLTSSREPEFIPSTYIGLLTAAYDPSSRGSNTPGPCGHIHTEVVKILFKPGSGGTHFYS